MSFIKKLVVFFMFFLPGFAVQLYSQQLALKTYSVEDGLVQSSVYSILQDRDGYLWFGTEGGVSKFDGVRFTNYTSTNGLTQNDIRVLFQDSKGKYWFGSENNGVVLLDNNRFIGYDITKGLKNNTILSIFQDKRGRIWLGTLGGGINIFENGKISVYSKENGLASDTVRSIFEDSKGNFWFCYTSAGYGVTCLSSGKYKHFTQKDGLVSNYVIAIIEDKMGNLWFCSYEGISRFDGKRFINYNKLNGLPDVPIIAAAVDKQNNIWFATYGAGILLYSQGKFSRYSSKNGLISDFIYSVFVDDRNDVWLGTNDGINRIPAERFLCFTIKDGLLNQQIYAINQDIDGNIWFGTYGAGVIKVNKNKISVFNKKNGFPDDYVSSIFIDKEGILWFGTKNSGLVCLRENKFINYTIKDGLCDNYIYQISGDEKNNLWIATNNGACYFDKKKFINYTQKDGLPENKVFSILEDKRRNIWFATNNGIAKLQDGKFQIFKTQNNLANNFVLQIYEDSIGDIWFVTQDGLSRFHENKLISYKNILSVNSCYSIIEENNFLFVGTSNGINKLDLTKIRGNQHSIKPIVYSAKEGLSGSECTEKGIFRDKDGNIWIGTLKGVTVYNSNNSPNVVPPRVYIKSIKVLDNKITPGENISLSYNQNYITIDFNSVNFSSPEKNLYIYKLEGIDSDWKVTSQNSIQFPYLPPGNYKFLLKVMNSDLIYSLKATVFEFSIEPPFWATFWFRAIVTIISISLVYAFYIYKTKQVKKRNIELEETVQDRTKELEQEKNKSDELLLNILPDILVNELKEKGFVQPREYKNITIMFTDFKGFTYIADVLPADRLVNELNDIYKEFDKIIERNKVEKLKTIGDSYMIGAGLPVESEDHAVRIVKTGLEMQAFIFERNKTSAIKWDMRAGVHSGNVIAGVVGTKKFTYDIWGDTVNIASRLESAGEPGQINISAYTYMLVRDYFYCEYRGKVSTKGKGELDMYFVKEPKNGS